MKEKQKIEMKKADDIPIATLKKVTIIPDGLHQGTITDIVHFNGEFEYLHLLITLDENGVEMQTGFPLTISLRSSLGKLLKDSGFDIEKQEYYSINDFRKQLLNRKVNFLTKETVSSKGTFAEILNSTIKFL